MESVSALVVILETLSNCLSRGGILKFPLRVTVSFFLRKDMSRFLFKANEIFRVGYDELKFNRYVIVNDTCKGRKTSQTKFYRLTSYWDKLRIM